jgi:hypothetical protein
LFCRPHHLNLTVTSLYAHIYGQSFWFTSSCLQLGPNGPRPVLIDLNFAGSSSAL